MADRRLPRTEFPPLANRTLKNSGFSKSHSELREHRALALGVLGVLGDLGDLGDLCGRTNGSGRVKSAEIRVSDFGSLSATENTEISEN